MIRVRRAGETRWTAPEASRYDREDHLQQVVADSPHWIPGVPEDALTVREFPTSAGPMDVMVVAREGALTAVECKLESNPEKRRTVLGQLLDYTSAVWRDGPDRFVANWNSRTTEPLDSALAPEALTELRDRIESGTIDLCWVVDRIDDDLRRLIEYLNEITRQQVGVTALQLTYVRHDDVEILIPQTYGGELAAAKATHAGGGAERWNRQSFNAAVEDPADQAFLQQLLGLLDRNLQTQRLGDHADLWFGTRPGGGMFFYPYGLRYPAFQLKIAGGNLSIAGCWQRFPQIAQHPGFAPLADMLGLSETGPASAVPIGNLNITPDGLWRVAEQVALVINGRPGPSRLDEQLR